jgi:hypothetical protein
MNKYTVYFSVFGKKMKTEIEAETVQLAREFVKNLIKIHKIVKREDEAVNFLKNILGMKG